MEQNQPQAVDTSKALPIQNKDNPCGLFPYVREDVMCIQDADQHAGWDITAFNLPDLWASTRGEGVKVAVIDTGCQLDHFDLVDNLLPGINFVEPGKPPEDQLGHGCIHPDSFVHTNFCGIERIKTLYERILVPELANVLPDGHVSWIKDVKGLGIKTYAIDTQSGQTVIQPIEYLHRTTIQDEITSVQLEGNVNLELTSWHPVYLCEFTAGGRHKIIKKKAEDLIIGDKFISPNGNNAGRLIQEPYRGFGKQYKQCNTCGHLLRYFIKRDGKCKKCKNTDWKFFNSNHLITEDLAYLIGIVITDGHINVSSRRVEICSKTPEILNKIFVIANKLGFSVKMDYPKNRCARVLIFSTDLIALFINLGILNKRKSYDQTLPEFVGKSPYEIICSFLAGVIDGDGCISTTNTKNRITTISRVFAEQLACLFNSIGMKSSIQIYKNYAYDKIKIPIIKNIFQCVFCAVPESIAKFLAHPKKILRSQIKPSNKSFIRRVKSISKKQFNGCFYDFTVKETHTYIANGHFVSNTHAIGIICALDNNIGIVGVAPLSKVMPVKVLDAHGNGNMDNVAAGIHWAVDNGADIISMSLGGPNPLLIVQQACQYADSKGVPIFCAAGNSGNTENIFFPSRYKETISVGSIDENMDRAAYSCTGENLDFMAPGTKIMSTVPKNWYALMTGTCVAEGSYVYTTNGPKKIENIIVGDEVFAYKDGDIVTRLVQGNFYRGESDVYRIKSAGRDAMLTDSHRVLTLNIHNKEVEWVSIGALKEYHRLLLPRSLKNNINTYLDSILTDDFCWLLGFFLGNGWISYSKRGMRVNFAAGDKPEVIEKVERIYSAMVGKNLKRSLNGDWDYDDSTMISMIISSLGLNYYAKDKSIPAWVWNLPKSKQEILYLGYRFADGHARALTNIEHFECASGDLIRRLAILSDYNGWKHYHTATRVRLNKAPNSNKAIEEYKTSYNIGITRNPVLGGWTCMGKKGEQTASEMGLDINALFCAKWAIDPTPKKSKVYDLNVPDADCFITQGIITHNSMACPWVAGIACLYLAHCRQRHPDRIPSCTQDYRNAFQKYTIPINNEMLKDKKFYQGFGILDPRKMHDELFD